MSLAHVSPMGLSNFLGSREEGGSKSEHFLAIVATGVGCDEWFSKVSGLFFYRFANTRKASSAERNDSPR